MRHLYFTLLILVTACGTMKENPKMAENEVETPTIGFFNYTIAKAADNSIDIRFINKISADGELKTRGQDTPAPAVSDLKCIQVSAAQVRLDSIVIADPLVQDMEYVGGDGALGVKRIELDSTEFSVRMQLHPRAKYIVIEKADQPNKPLLKTEL